jgi:lipoprotein-anchoring transpeptidase ErfK/SrfK
MDSFQSPSPNDQRRFSTTELAIAVNPAELNAPSPDAAPQPTPVNQTTLAPSAKTLELMRQLEALAHEIALVSRGDSSNQCIKVQEGSNFSAGLQLVEPSPRVSPRDQLASDTPLFGRRTNLTLPGFFAAARDRLGSYRPSFGKPSATLANLFIAARDRLASYRPSFGKPSTTLVGIFIAARDRLGSYRPSFDRPSATLAGFFILARDWLTDFSPSFGRQSTTLVSIFILTRDWLASLRQSFGRRTFLTLAIFIATLIGVAATFVWQSQRVSTAKPPNDVAVAKKQSGVTPVGQVPLQNSPPQPAPVTQTAPAPTAPAAAAQEQLAAKQEQIDQNIAKPQAVKRDIKHARETVRLNGYSAGTIVIKTNERHLYYVTGEGQAIRYRVGVGKAGMAWTGQSSIDGKYISPAWQAPDSIRRDRSRAAPVIPGGSPSNPMGAAALTLSGGGQYAIHGTNNPGSIGGFVSHGCIRMYNQDIMDLYARVSVGTKVVVLR